jgi:DNA polymerase-1
MDENLLRVVNEGVSLHDITAQGLGIDRKLAKTINFAIQYGAGTKKIQKILKCSDIEADRALKKYWDTYPGLKTLIDKCHSCVDQGIAIENPFGRERHLYAENPADKWGVEKVKRQAFNSLIQGTGADITNTAFVRICEELIKSGQGRGLFVVHDEILIEVDSKYALYWNSRLETVMSQVGKDINLRVPLTAEGQVQWIDGLTR